MKNLYASICCFCLLNVAVYAQPCSGTPAANTITAQSYTVCLGDSTNLGLAYTYTNTGITYQWYSSTTSSVGPFSAIPGATLNNHSTGASTVHVWYQVMITCINSSLSVSATQGIMVSLCTTTCSGTPPTSIIAVSDTVCATDVAKLSLSTTYTDTGITFQWGSAPAASGPYTAIPGATLNTYTSTPLSADAYYNVVVTCTNVGGATVTATQSIAVVSCTSCAGVPGANSVVPANHTICAGSAASMSLANSYSASGIVYQWQTSTVSAVGPFSSIPGATLSSYTSASLSNNAYYNVVVTCTASGQSISVPHTVSVVTCTTPCIANANFTLVPTSTPQLWNAIPSATAGISAAQWQWGDGTVSNTLFTSHQYTAAGMYTICLSVSVTCGSSTMACSSYSVYRQSSEMIQVNVVAPGTVGLSEKIPYSHAVSVYPNPNNGHFNVQVNGSRSVTVFEVTNLVGQKVLETRERVSGSLTKEFDLSHLPEGVYFLKVSQEENTSLMRISIRK